MKELKQLIINTLQAAFDFPVFQLGTIEPNAELPADYFTFRIDSSDDVNFDNDAALTAWDININYFSTDPEKVAFIPQGRGYDLISDTPDYSGWYSDYYFLQTNKGV